MFPPKRRLSVQLSRHANFMAFLLLWPNKIPISPRSRMLTFNFNAFLTNICVGRLWNMAIYGNRLYFTVPFYTHFFSKVDLSECFHIFLPWCLLLVENVLSKISLQEDDILYTASEPSCSSGICTLVLNIHTPESELEYIYSTYIIIDAINIFLSFRTSIQCRSCCHQYWSLSNFNGETPIVETLSFSHYLRASVIFRAQFSVSWWQGKKINRSSCRRI